MVPDVPLCGPARTFVRRLDARRSGAPCLVDVFARRSPRPSPSRDAGQRLPPRSTGHATGGRTARRDDGAKRLGGGAFDHLRRAPLLPTGDLRGGRIDLLAGDDIDARPAAAYVYNPVDARHASLRGDQAFAWPLASTADGRIRDLSQLPAEADGCHDHIGLTLPQGAVDLLGADGTAGLRLTWDAASMPHALLWQHFLPSSSPWPGDVLAIEPTSSWGRTRSETMKRGEAQVVASGESIRTWMSIEVIERDPSDGRVPRPSAGARVTSHVVVEEQARRS